MSTAQKIIDRDLALQQAGGSPDLARELFGMLMKELPVYRDELPLLYQGGDRQQLLGLVHKLNGAATYCGVPELKETVSAFESRLRAGDEAAFEQGLNDTLAAIEHIIQEAAGYDL